jgi:hypothetical protein
MKIRIGAVLAAVALASGVVVYDRTAKPLDFPTPVQGHTTSVTTTPTSHPPR